MAYRDSTSQIIGATTTITPASGVATMNCLLNDNFVMTPSTNVVLSASNVSTRVGQKVTLLILTSGYTSYNIVLGTGFKSKGVYRTNKTDATYEILTFYSDGTNLIEYGTRNFSVWTPANEPSCVLALEADSYALGDGTTITGNFLDYSPYNRTVTISGTPIYKTAILNGLGVFRLNVSHTGDSINLPNLSPFTSMSMYIVWKLAAQTDGGNILGTDPTQASHYYYNDGNIYDGSFSTARKGPITSNVSPLVGTWHLLQIHSRPGYYQMLQNAVSIHGPVANLVGIPTAPKIGVNNATPSPFYFSGDIQSVYLFNDQPDLSIDKRVRDYIKLRTTVG